MFVVLTLMSHWAACIWGLIGDPENIGLETMAEPIPPGVCEPGGPCEPTIEGSPWIHRYGMDNYDTLTKYFAAMHFAVGLVTQGPTPMEPGSPLERIYTIVLMMCGIFVTSVVVGEVLLIMDRQRQLNLAFDEQMASCREFMTTREVSINLQERVYRYLESQQKAKQGDCSANRA